MRRLIRSMFGPAMFLAVALAGVPPAYAGCLDNAGDFLWGALSGGASVAACELKELVEAIQNFIKTVSDLATNVASNAKKVADAAVGAINSTANEMANVLGGSQRDLGNELAEANAMTSTFAMAPAQRLPAPGGAAQNRTAATAPHALARTASPGGMRPGVASAPILLGADPQRLHAALERGVQALTALKRSVDQDAASRINAALQRARNQASSHLSDAADIVQTALLAPINALLGLLNDLVRNPAQLLDPIATINTMVNDISKNVVSTLNHINDVITKDAVTTLGSVEGDVQHAQSAAQEGGKLLGLMRRAHQERTQAALQALESELNAVAPRQNGIGQAHTLMSPGMATFRFAPVRSRLHATLAQAVAPTQTLANNLSSSWATIRARHPNARVHPLDPGSLGTAKAQLDRLFLGKPPSEIARAKQDLLNQARQRYGSNPQLLAAIEQNLDGYLRTHSLAAVRAPVMAAPPHAAAPRGGIGVIRQ